jgi:hypothetical protein
LFDVIYLKEMSRQRIREVLALHLLLDNFFFRSIQPKQFARQSTPIHSSLLQKKIGTEMEKKMEMKSKMEIKMEMHGEVRDAGGGEGDEWINVLRGWS